MDEKVLVKVKKAWFAIAVFITAVFMASGVCIMTTATPSLKYFLLFIVLPILVFALFIVQKVFFRKFGVNKAFSSLVLLSVARMTIVTAVMAVSTAVLVSASWNNGDDIGDMITYGAISLMITATLLSIISMIAETGTFRRLRNGGDPSPSAELQAIRDTEKPMKNRIASIERITLAVVETFIGVALLLAALYCIPAGAVFYIPTLAVFLLLTVLQSVFFRKLHFKDSRVFQIVLSCIKWIVVILTTPIFVFLASWAGWNWSSAGEMLPKLSFPNIMSSLRGLVITLIIVAGLAAIAALVMELVFSARIKKRNTETEGNE